MYRSRIILTILTTGLMVAVAAPNAQAAASTSRSAISVAQVQSMLDQAAANPTARQVLTAYLAGVGETAGILVSLAKAEPGTTPLSCKRTLVIDDRLVQAALAQPTVNNRDAVETSATPLIVREMLKRADCDVRR
jgi:hypothetical protein